MPFNDLTLHLFFTSSLYNQATAILTMIHNLKLLF